MESSEDRYLFRRTFQRISEFQKELAEVVKLDSRHSAITLDAG